MTGTFAVLVLAMHVVTSYASDSFLIEVIASTLRRRKPTSITNSA